MLQRVFWSPSVLRSKFHQCCQLEPVFFYTSLMLSFLLLPWTLTTVWELVVVSHSSWRVKRRRYRILQFPVPCCFLSFHSKQRVYLTLCLSLVFFFLLRQPFLWPLCYGRSLFTFIPIDFCWYLCSSWVSHSCSHVSSVQSLIFKPSCRGSWCRGHCSSPFDMRAGCGCVVVFSSICFPPLISGAPMTENYFQLSGTVSTFLRHEQGRSQRMNGDWNFPWLVARQGVWDGRDMQHGPAHSRDRQETNMGILLYLNWNTPPCLLHAPTWSQFGGFYLQKVQPEHLQQTQTVFLLRLLFPSFSQNHWNPKWILVSLQHLPPLPEANFWPLSILRDRMIISSGHHCSYNRYLGKKLSYTVSCLILTAALDKPHPANYSDFETSLKLQKL